ncbi:MAG: hypothetical protein WC723_02870 [Candidatus Omnitrophota bacterium]
MFKQFTKAQSLVEYSIILAVVLAALMGMQLYMKRGLQAGVKVAADQLGSQESADVLINFKRQANTVSNTTALKSGVVRTQVSEGGSQTKATDITDTVVSSSVSTMQE